MGERSVMWIDGEITHAIRKSPRLGDDPESVSEALPIAADEREIAEAVIADIPHDLLYARIDVIRDSHDQPLLAELNSSNRRCSYGRAPPHWTDWSGVSRRALVEIPGRAVTAQVGSAPPPPIATPCPPDPR